MTLEEAIAEVRRVIMAGEKPSWHSALANNVILNAAVSGDLIPLAEVQAAHRLAEARNKALDEAQLAAQQCLIDLAHSTGQPMQRRSSALIGAEPHVSLAIRNLKGPTA